MCKESPDTCSREEFFAKKGAADVPPRIRQWFERYGIWPTDPERPLMHLRPGELLAPVEEKVGDGWVRWVEASKTHPFTKKDVQMWSRRDGGRRSVPRGKAWALITRFAAALMNEQNIEVVEDNGELFTQPEFYELGEALEYLLEFYFIRDEEQDLKREATEATLARVAGELSLNRLYDLMHCAKLLSMEDGRNDLVSEMESLGRAIRVNDSGKLTAIKNRRSRKV